jgi:hypothetical protein
MLKYAGGHTKKSLKTAATAVTPLLSGFCTRKILHLRSLLGIYSN